MAQSDVRISDHGYDALGADGISVADILAGLDTAVVVEDYPEHAKCPCVLVLEFDTESKPIHVVWGIPRGLFRPAVVVTAYRPDLASWSADFLERLK